MDLPKELRLTVFEYLLGPIRPHSLHDHENGSNNARIVMGSRTLNNPATPVRMSDWYEKDWQKALRDVPAPDLAILRLNKALHKEALHAGWIGSKKYFIEPQYLKGVLACPKPPRGNWLSRIRLTSGTSSWFDFLGVSLFPQMHLDHNKWTSNVLPSVSTLTTLELKFPNPHENPHEGVSCKDDA